MEQKFVEASLETMHWPENFAVISLLLWAAWLTVLGTVAWTYIGEPIRLARKERQSSASSEGQSSSKAEMA